MSINSRNGNTLLESGFFAPCRAATVGANIALSGLLTLDGVALAAGDRVLVKDQTDPTTNGIYAANTGTWVRTTDAAGNSQFFDGMAVIVAQGTISAGLTYICTCTDDPVVIGVSLLTFASQSAVASAMSSATSTSSVAIGTGSKTFATQAGKNFAVNNWLLIWETATPANAMLGQVTAYSGTSLTVNVTATGGSGTHADWSIALTGSPATQGLVPPIGTGNVTGPGSAVDGNLPAFDGTTGKLVKDSGKAAGTLASRNTLVYGDAGTATIPAAALAADVLRGPIIGQPGVTENFLLSNDGTNATRDVDVGPGRCEDDSFTTKMRLKGTMVKRLDQAWAAGGASGSPVGGTDAGGTKAASKTLHAYVIGKLGQSVTSFSRTSNVATLTIAGHGLGVGGTVEVQGIGSGIDASAAIAAAATNTLSYANTGVDIGATACAGIANGFDVLFSRQELNAYPSPSMPSGWTVKQCLGSVMTDGSANVIAFSQVGDEFLLATPIANISNAAPGDTAGHLVALSVPIGVKVGAILNFVYNNGNTAYLSSPDQTDSAPSTTAAPGATLWAGGATNQAQRIAGLRTNTSGQVRYRLATNAAVTMVTVGFNDPRRRLF